MLCLLNLPYVIKNDREKKNELIWWMKKKKKNHIKLIIFNKAILQGVLFYEYKISFDCDE